MNTTSGDAKSIFLAAAELTSPAERRAYLDAACAGDVALRRDMEEMLAHHAQLGSFLQSPASALAATDHSAAEGPGTQIGPYKLVDLIGEGGMGAVYLAQQTEPVKRLVALKVIKAGMDSKQVLARFEAERQALAMMDHPNIAKVHDAGAMSEGRPYFVMELVKGVPITRFCDERKLTPRERLELFVPMCQAIQHAHQKGIIHRDIKPSNMLVALYDGKPVPKVIDFGVAKAMGQPLTERTLVTGLGAVVGTPEYMSPEQAELNQLDIDTRSDIYSLGILLYELLTGTTPVTHKRIKEAALLEVLRLVREEDPPRPSTRLSTTQELPRIAANRGLEPRRLSGLVRGELDWIVMKCLEKDRNRRYETADGLARDVERYLRDQPVEASPPGAGYLLRKFVKRNRGRVAAAVLVLAALLSGMAGTTWGMIRAEQARQDAVAAQFAEAERAAGERRAKEEAQTRLAQVEKGTEILASVFRDSDPIAAEKAGVTSQDLLSRRLSEAAQHLEGDAVGEPLVVARLQHFLGITLRELGHLKQAEGVLVKACRTRARLLGADDVDTVATKHHLAVLYRAQKRYALAEALFDEVVAIRTATLGADDLDTVATKHHLVVLYLAQKKYALAETLCQEVLAIRSAKLGAEDLDTLAAKHNLAVLYRVQEKYALAEPLYKEVLALRTAKLGADHADNLRTRYHLALLYRSQKKYAPAEALYKEVLAVRTAKLRADDLGTLHIRKELAEMYCDQENYAPAEPLYKEILAVRTAKQGANNSDTLYSQYDLAVLYRYMNKLEQAIPLLEDTLKRCRATGEPPALGVQADLGACYRDARRFAEAIPLLEEVHRAGRKDLAWVGNALLTSYVGAGKTTEAVALATEQVRAAREQFPADSAELAAELAPPGEALLQVQKYAAAEPLLLIRYKGLRQSQARIPPQVDPRLRDAVERLVELYDAWGRPDDAAKWRKELESHGKAPETVNSKDK